MNDQVDRVLKDRDQLVEDLGLQDVSRPDAPLFYDIIRLSKISVLKSENSSTTEKVTDEEGSEFSSYLDLNSKPSSLVLEQQQSPKIDNMKKMER